MDQFSQNKGTLLWGHENKFASLNWTTDLKIYLISQKLAIHCFFVIQFHISIKPKSKSPCYKIFLRGKLLAIAGYWLLLLILRNPLTMVKSSPKHPTVFKSSNVTCEDSQVRQLVAFTSLSIIDDDKKIQKFQRKVVLVKKNFWGIFKASLRRAVRHVWHPPQGCFEAHFLPIDYSRLINCPAGLPSGYLFLKSLTFLTALLDLKFKVFKFFRGCKPQR